MATLEAERAQLAQELATIDNLTKGGEASVDELERALTRRAALELRTRAVDARIAAERAKAAQEAAQKRAQEAAALKTEADQVIRKVIDALLPLQGLGRQHMEMMQRIQTLGGVSFSADNRGQTLCATLNGLLQMLAPGRFYPIDQRGTLADREHGG